MAQKPSVHVVILAGGSGTRFWPKSTPENPKQLLSFGDQKSLLEKTIQRFHGIIPESHFWILTSQKLEKKVREIPLISSEINVLAEPCSKNTAPCIFWAAKEIEKTDPDALMMVLPSDHAILNEDEYLSQMKKAFTHVGAQPDGLYTFGIQPIYPETGYGYIETSTQKSGPFYSVNRFVEKPNLEKAEEYIKAGNYLWNAGMFLWKVKTILSEFDQHMPELKKIWVRSTDLNDAFQKFPSESIDYAVMEKSKKVFTLPLDCGWDDLGSWAALENYAKARGLWKEDGFVMNGEVRSIDSKDNIVDADGLRVSLLGVEDLVVVKVGHEILICKKDRSQDVKKFTS